MTSTSTAASDAGIQTPEKRQQARAKFDTGNLLLWGLFLLTAAIVVPPILFLVEASLTIEGVDARIGFDHYASVLGLSGWKIWRVSLTYAAGSSCFAIAIGVTAAWLVARTNAYFRQVTILAGYLSLAAPVMVKAIGWILLLGPNKGVINEALRTAFGIVRSSDRAFLTDRHDSPRGHSLGSGGFPAHATGAWRDGPHP